MQEKLENIYFAAVNCNNLGGDTFFIRNNRKLAILYWQFRPVCIWCATYSSFWETDQFLKYITKEKNYVRFAIIY